MTSAEVRADGVMIDRSDAKAYGAGLLSWADYVRRVVERNARRIRLRPLQDPVAIYDAMRESATTLLGTYLRLADLAEGAAEACR